MIDIVLRMQQTFEQCKHDDGGGEYRIARELMPVLGYNKRERFLDTIKRAQKSGESGGKIVFEDFSSAPEKTSRVGGRPPQEDLKLIRDRRTGEYYREDDSNI